MQFPLKAKLLKRMKSVLIIQPSYIYTELKPNWASRPVVPQVWMWSWDTNVCSQSDESCVHLTYRITIIVLKLREVLKIKLVKALSFRFLIVPLYYMYICIANWWHRDGWSHSEGFPCDTASAMLESLACLVQAYRALPPSALCFKNYHVNIWFTRIIS